MEIIFECSFIHRAKIKTYFSKDLAKLTETIVIKTKTTNQKA